MIDIRDMLDAAGSPGATRDARRRSSAAALGTFERTGQEDHRPSWSVNKTTYLHFCFSCGYKGTLTQLLVDLTGAAPVDLVDELRKQSFLSRIAVREEPEETLEPVISEWAHHQPAGRRASPKLLELRWLARSAIDRYQVRWNRRYQAVGAADPQPQGRPARRPVPPAGFGAHPPGRDGRRAARCSATTWCRSTTGPCSWSHRSTPCACSGSASQPSPPSAPGCQASRSRSWLAASAT